MSLSLKTWEIDFFFGCFSRYEIVKDISLEIKMSLSDNYVTQWQFSIFVTFFEQNDIFGKKWQVTFLIEIDIFRKNVIIHKKCHLRKNYSSSICYKKNALMKMTVIFVRKWLYFCNFFGFTNWKNSFPKSLSSFQNEEHVFEANAIVTKMKNTLSKRCLKCFSSVFHLYKMKKHAFETFPSLQNENTLLKRFSFLQNEKKIALKRMSSLQNEDTYFRNVFMFTKWKHIFEVFWCL